MSYKYFQSPRVLTGINFSRSLFLGGSISGADDWQENAKNQLINHYDIVNPRRAGAYDVKNDQQQIRWEYLALRACSDLLFYFDEPTVAPITLFELGSALERFYYEKGQTITVVSHPNYARLRDLHIQCSYFGISIILGLQEGIDFLKTK